jgi:hypothetical protein
MNRLHFFENNECGVTENIGSFEGLILLWDVYFFANFSQN